MTWTTSVSGSDQVSVSMEWEHDVGGYAHWGGSFAASFQPRGARSDAPPPDASSAMGPVNKFWDLVAVGAGAGGAAALDQSTWTRIMAADDTGAIEAESGVGDPA